MQTKRIRNIFLYIIPAVVLLMLFFSKNLYYRYTDDEWMNNIARGLFTGRPDEHIVYINVVFGYLTKTLYSITKNINWFGILYLLIVLFFVYSCMSILKKYISIYYALIISICFECIAIFWFTFTALSYLCVATGVIVLVDSTTNNTKKDNLKTIVGIALITISFILRNTACLTGIVLTSPLFIVKIKDYCKNKKAYISLLSIIICVLSLCWINNSAYSSNMWKEYSQYNSLRSGVFDYHTSSYEQGKKTYEELSYSENDIICLTSLCFGDYKVFHPQKLKLIIKNTPFNVRYNFNPITYPKELRKIVYVKSSYYLVLFIIFGFVIVCIFSIIFGRKNRLFYVLQSLFGIGMILLLFILNRAVPRVIVSIVACSVMCIMYSLIKNKELNSNKIVVKIIMIGCLFASIVLLYKNIDNSNYNKIRYEKNQTDVMNYVNNHKKQLFLCQGKHIWLYHKSIIDIRGKGICGNIMQTGDQDIYSACYYKQLDNLRVPKKRQKELIKTLINTSNVYLLVDKTEDDDMQSMILSFLKEHTGNSIRSSIVKRFNNNNTILYKFKAINK